MSDYYDNEYGEGDDDYGGRRYRDDGDDYRDDEEYDYYRDDEDEKEYDYRDDEDRGDYNEDLYERVEQQIAENVFRDFERIGHIIDENLEIPVGTETTKLDPDLKFKLDIRRILGEVDLGFSEQDKSIIKKKIRELPFIQYKNAWLYVLGYYYYMEISKEQRELVLKNKIKRVEEYIKREGYFTIYEVVKYGRYWENILIKTN